MKITLDQLVRNLTDSGLMPADEVESFCGGLSSDDHPNDPETVIQGLISTGKLTPYQADCLCQGETTGLVFDEYLVLDKIGQGGMGVVLKAQHRRMNRIVAVKKLPVATLESEDAVKRFYREVEAAARLTHPNIVAAHDAREHEGVHYLIMEYVVGQDLAEILKEQGPLPVEDAVGHIVQAAQGLEYAHKRGIIHRDIKPANLLLDSEGTVKILDMGLARMATDAGTGDVPDQLTTSGQVMGTCDYMAPEQAEDTHSVDHRADIYSLGCTLYRLLTGQPMYSGSTLMKVLLSHREAGIPSLTEKRPDIPASVDAVFQRMVAKQPNDRYASMAEVVKALQAALGRGPAPSVTPEPDSGLVDFLDQIRDKPSIATATGRGSRRTASATATAKPKAKQETPPTIEETIDLSAKADTDPNTVTQPSAPVAAATPSPPKSAARRKQKQLTVLVGAGAGISLVGAILVAAILYVQTNNGTVVVQTDDKDVEVLVKQGGEVVDIIDAEDRWRVEVKSGEYHVELKGGNDQFLLDKDTIKVTRGGEVRVRVEVKPPQVAKGRGPPQPAIAPFDAAQAKKHQQEWADYLGMPVQREIDLPGGEKLTMMLIPPGDFLMGSIQEERQWALEQADANREPWAIPRIPAEQPQHLVRIAKTFYLAKYEVTQAQWESVMGDNPSLYAHPNNPVENVSWPEAQAFLEKLNTARVAEGAKFALPTEAEWEYACRAGTLTAFCYSNAVEDAAILGQYGWYSENSASRPHPVGTKKPNAWGIYDAHGNVWEWCADWYGADYYAQPLQADPVGPPTGDDRVIRGGGWNHAAALCRSAFRNYYAPDGRNGNLGFRLACEISLPPESKPAKPSVSSSQPRAERPSGTTDEPANEATSYRPPVVEPELVKSFAQADLYQFLVSVVDDSRSDFMQRLLYTEIAATMQREHVGTWRLGPGMTRDGQACVFSVKNAQWFARKLTEAEARELGLSGNQWGRTIDVVWKPPVEQIMEITAAEVRIETDAKGNAALAGTIRCKVDEPRRVDYLSLVLSSPSLEEGENVTREVYQYVRPERLPGDTFQVHIPLDPGEDLPRAGRFYFQAFLFEPKASFFRISNELIWAGGGLETKTPEPAAED